MNKNQAALWKFMKKKNNNNLQFASNEYHDCVNKGADALVVITWNPIG